MARKIYLILFSLFCFSLVSSLGDSSRLTIMTYNIHHAEGTDGKVDYVRMSDVIREMNPDIVALQEVDNGTRRTEGVKQAEKLASLAGYKYFVFRRSMPYDGGEYGLAIMSRFPILESESYPLPFRQNLEPRSLLVTRIKIDENGGFITVADTHLCSQSEENRIDQVRRINTILSGIEEPVLLAGDFNARREDDSMRLMWSREWSDLSASHSRIDYILSRAKDRVKVTGSRMLEDRVTSDHFPILVKIELPE